MEYRILGTFEARSNGRLIDLGPPKQRSLLALLLLNADHVVATDTIMESLWGESPPQSAAHSIQVYVSNLRKALPADSIETSPPGYTLRLASSQLDAARFEELVGRADRAMSDDPESARDLLEDALGIWRGPALSEFRYEEFAHAEAERLDHVHLLAQELSCRALVKLGRIPEALPLLHGLVAAHPLRDGFVELLMEALARQGHQAEALRLYQAHRRRLAEELGIDPSPQLSRLEERILLQDSELGSLAPATEPPDLSMQSLSTHNPYRGLRPFREEDADNFFGRDQLLDQLVQSLTGDARMLGVVGPSGSGKSSVVRAGLLPRLRSGAVPGSASWQYAVMVPSAHPFTQLEAALIRSSGRDIEGGLSNLFDGGEEGMLRAVLRVLENEDAELLLVIDQLEELFTLTKDEDERTRFLRNLVTAVEDPHSRVRLVTTLRGDFFDRPMAFPEFGKLFTDNLVSVMPFSPEEYEAAAVGPAANVGVGIEPSLLTSLVTDVMAQPGGLPLFEYTLAELFLSRTDETLRLESYRQIGGLKGALTGRAELAFMGLDASEQDIAGQLLLRLVARSPTGEVVRRRLPESEMRDLGLDQHTLTQVVRTFGRHGLITFDLDTTRSERTVEISHDALLGAWPRLAEAITERDHDLAQHAALAASLEEWTAAGEDPDYLLSGGRLSRYTAWYEASPMRLTDEEQRFLDLSGAAEEQREAESSEKEAQRHALERRARNRLRALVGIVAMLVIAFGVVLVGWFVNQPPRVVILHEGEGAGFSQLSLLGAQRAARDFDVPVDEVVALTGYEDKVREAAESGFDVIVTSATSFVFALEEVAPNYPDVVFTIHDTVVELPNVVSLLYAEEEGSYLAGAAAALTSETGTIGFVGGLQIPLIEKFRAGYEAGARAVDPDIQVLTSWLTDELDFGRAFLRPDLGRRAAEAQYTRGADVIYHAAGQSGSGVLEAATSMSTPTSHLWVIGVDVDQYVTASEPEKPHVLTSMIKRVDIGVYETIRAAVEGDLPSGVIEYDLAAGGVALAESGGLSAEHRTILDGLATAVISGEVEVPTQPEAAKVVALVAAEPTATATLTFDGQTCVFAGPTAITPDDVIEVSVSNETDEFFTLSLVATEQTSRPETLDGPSAAPPPWARLDLSPFLTLEPQSNGILYLEPRAAGYVVTCLTEEWAFNSDFISVGSP